jgi:hypothetical protein
MDRQAEIDLIAAHLAGRGVTRCPTRYVWPVDGSVSEVEIKARLAAMPRPRPQTHEEYARAVGARLFPRRRRR